MITVGLRSSSSGLCDRRQGEVSLGDAIVGSAVDMQNVAGPQM